MSDEKLPQNHPLQRQEHRAFVEAVESLGKVVRDQGPIDGKLGHLIQLAASVAIYSKGAVHSHVRRGLETGATAEEINHAIILLTSTLGFPTVNAALSRTQDILAEG
jgi:4-carboxymuconolactone decarboxylase